MAEMAISAIKRLVSEAGAKFTSDTWTMVCSASNAL
jgi:hypothetical protein